MKLTSFLGSIASFACIALADVPACTKGGQVDGQNPIGPWTEREQCLSNA